MNKFFRASPRGLPHLAAASMILLVAAMPAHAAPDRQPRLLVDSIAPGAEASTAAVRVVAVNASDTLAVSIPSQLEATLTTTDEQYRVALTCTPEDGTGRIEPGRFGAANCIFALPGRVTAGTAMQLALEPATPAPSSSAPASPAYAFSLPATPPMDEEAESGSSVLGLPLAESPVPSAEPESGNAFLGNLSAYQPIYAAYGPGTDSDARLQLSFKYQLFGNAGDVGGDAPIVNGIHFGYSQHMFWDLGADSSPFRNIDFMPELFYLQPAVDLGDGISLGGQLGVRHESNGQDEAQSRSANTIYLQPVGTFQAGDFTVAVGPRLFFYVGDLEDNPDIRRYRGSTGLFLEIGQDDGLRLTTQSRFNFASGKGAIDGELSYPLDRIVDTDLNLYVFGQGFAGYGENLLDYNRKTTRLRVGFAIVR